jgi:hypothetical protein
MQKYSTSPNTSFMDQGIQLTDLQKSAKLLSRLRTQAAKEPTQSFYLRYYFLLSIAFSNNLLYFGLHYGESELLTISLGLLMFLMLYSFLCVICADNADLPKCQRLFNPTNLLLLTGVGLLLIDPDVLNYLLNGAFESWLSSMQTLLLLATLNYGYSERSVLCAGFVVALGTVSFVLSLLSRSDFYCVVYEFVVLVAFALLGGAYLLAASTKIKRKVKAELPVGSEHEEITSSIDRIVEKMMEVQEREEGKVVLDDLIRELQSINTRIKTVPNIYATNMNAVTKGLDEQDKIFIEQACFDTFSKSKSAQISPILSCPKIEANYGVSELMGVLKNIGREWNFNTVFIADCSGGTPLQVIGSYALRRYGFDDTFSMTSATIQNFMQELEEQYHKNPYHNSCHAADVMCSMSFLVQSSMLMEHVTSLELLACVLASLAHDVGHPGKNNRFLVLSRNEVAILYNDISVLEMMHASTLFKILRTVDCNILEACVGDHFTQIRKDIIDMILATDMGKHFELLGQFKIKYLGTELHDFTSVDMRTDLFKLMIKAADIGHTAKNTDLHEYWVAALLQEFFEQGDLEKELGLPVSMYCDRDNSDVNKSQPAFIKNIVQPLFLSLNTVLCSHHIEEKCLQQLVLNIKYWENKRKFYRGQSLMVKPEEVGRRSLTLPKIRTRKSSLPEKVMD